jgi:hypothetical protein
VPLIQPEKKTTNEQLTVTLASDTLQELRAYARFLNHSSVSYVLTQLIASLGRDKEFQQWKTVQQQDLISPPSPITKNGANPVKE